MADVLLWVAIVVGLLIIGFLIFVATRPGNFRIQRSAVISSPQHAVFGLINNFHEWVQWSPWEKIDPNLQRTYEGPSAGPGAIYSWVGSKKVGEGRMTILDSKPGELISIRLEFLKPFKTTNQTTFRFTPSGDGTRVDWIMDGKHNFMGKAFSAVMIMDKMVGKDFEQGLANLESAARSRSNPA